MSGLEWLAVPPILESSVKAIFKAYMLNKAALETFENAARYVSDLELCHLRLLCWLIASEMVSTERTEARSLTWPSRGTATDGPVIQKVYAMALAEILSCFDKLHEIFKFYDFPTALSEVEFTVANTTPPPAPSRWTIESIKALQSRVILKLKENTSYRRKIRFEVEHKEPVEHTLSQLWKYVDMLITGLPPADRLQLDVEDQIYMMNKMAQNSVQELFHLKKEASTQGDRIRAASYTTAATFKQAREEYEAQVAARDGHIPNRPYSTLLVNHTLQLTSQPGPELSARQLGTLTLRGQQPEQGRRVLVELKQKRDRNGLLHMQQAEVNLLCSLLSCKSSDIHPDLRVLQCLGHLSHPTEEPNYFAVIFALPPKADIALPMTLYDLLCLRRGAPENLPSLESRRGLAVRLAKAVWRLHQYEWFHKGLTSSNVLFFPSPLTEPDLRKDFYLAGFDNMRLKSSHSLTNTDSAIDNASRANFYRHPAFLGGVTDFEFSMQDGYAPAFDFWSLGIILCEISMWAPVDSGKFVRLKKENGCPLTKLAGILRSQQGDDMYKRSPVSELSHRMGDHYWSAVVNCFGAGENAKDCRWIAEKIIRPLMQASQDDPVV
ncbi:Fc.00g045370.m01.CDS01 [Cosmosporella sp. VM-42]